MLVEALVCLALNVYHEARDRPLHEQVAVASVVMNRVEDDRFPNSICAVVRQGGVKRDRCQFSWYCDGQSDEPTEQEAWTTSKLVAGAMLMGNIVDPTGGALFYHAPYVDPWWAYHMTETHRDGGHIYYKEKPCY